MNGKTTRRVLVNWLYATAAVHVLVGVLLPWIANMAMLDAYHTGIEAIFWNGIAPPAARAQQVWWISLFGPTLQNVGIWMAVLVRIGDRQRSAMVWGWLMAGVLLWAPQDMLISLRADCWLHVWLDTFALAVLIPPMACLYFLDRRGPLVAGMAGEGGTP